MKKSITVFTLLILVTNLCFVSGVNGQETDDYHKILNGDLSAFAGRWQTAKGNSIFLQSDGTIIYNDGSISKEKAENFHKNEDGTYSWNILEWYNDEIGYGGGYGIILYPIGIDVIVNGKVVETDISKVRLFLGQDYAPLEEMRDSIFYPQPLFSDVPEDHWAFEYIKAFADIGILTGYEDGTFRPDAPVTRAEWSKMLVSTFGLPIDEHWRMVLDLQSCDVRVSDWYAPYIYTAEPYFHAEHVDAEDQPMVLYRPEEGAAREDVTASIIKLWESVNYPVADDFSLAFSDMHTISTENQKYIAAAVNSGIISGFEDNTFRGQDTLTRAEAAAILYRTVLFCLYGIEG